MPDISKYSSSQTYVRPEPPRQGLSMIVNPVDTITVNKNVSAPESPVFIDKGAKASNDLLKNLGLVPMGGGAATDYDYAKRYNDEELLFNPYRDNEDLYAQNQSFWESLGSGLGRLTLLTGTKFGTGIGFLAGLSGVTNSYDKYGGAWDFDAWLSGASDNAISNIFEGAEDWVKQDLLPIYQEAKDRDKGFFRRMATDLNMWTDEGSDALAFIASAYIPAGLLGKLGIGAKFLTRMATAKGLTYADEAAALAAEGLSGGVESAAALEAGATTAPGALEAAVPTLVKANPYSAVNTLPRVFKLADNAKMARGVDVGITTFVNTASESMFEATEVKDQLTEKLSNEVDEFGNKKYTADQIRSMVTKGTADTFKMNMAALAVSNLWEANLFFKKLPTKGSEFSNKLNTTGVWSDATLQKKAFGTKVWGAGKTAATGIGAEGFWEENIQLAITRLNENNENFDLDFSDKLANLTEQYFSQTKQALLGKDVEASTSIGLGGVIGGGMSTVAHMNDGSNLKKSVSQLNSQVSAFKTYGNIYQTDTEGNLKLDENGSPVFDETKLKSYVASLNKIVGLQETARNMENRGVKEMAQIYKDEVFTRYAKAHFDNGLGDLMFQKLNDIQNISKEDMILLGFDPNSKDSTVAEQAEFFKNKANKLEDLYNNIQRNYLPNRNRKKFAEITDKMFYMSARIDSLNDVLNQTKANYDSVRTNSDAYNESFNRDTDRVVDGYNVLFQKNQSANKAFDFGIYENDAEYVERKTDVEKTKAALDAYVEENKESLKNLKTDSRGRYLYEVENKNLLPSAKEMERLQIVQAETELGIYNSTQILSRLADIKFGEKYYDQKFLPALQREAEKSIRENEAKQALQADYERKETDKTIIPGKNIAPILNEDEIDQAYEDAVNNGAVSEDKDKIVDHIANKIAKGQPLTDKEEAIRQTVKDAVEVKLQEKKDQVNLNDLGEAYEELTREKEALESMENRTDEQDNRLAEIYDELEAIEATRDEKVDEFSNEMTVANSNNIKETDKDEFKRVLNKIDQDRRRVKKLDDKYQIDGEDYRKVTEVIGDTISDEDREKRQNAIIAGYTVDEITKEFFEKGHLSPEFIATINSKISKEALDSMVKDLTNVRDELKKKGIEVVASNVFVFDKEQKIAGEIDILAIDKHGNFKIYEIQARRSGVYAHYGVRGVGITIRELDQQRLTAYRNLFANQYGVVPDEISVMFPFQVKYDKDSSTGYIEKVKRKEAIRFTPSRTVEVKRKFFEPIRTGSKFDNFDILRIFGSSFLPSDEAKNKMRFILRNVPLETVKKNVVLKIKKAPAEFQEKYNQQQALLGGQKTTHSLRKYPGMDNLYALSGNMEIAITHEGTLMGYMPPRQKLAYKDDQGNFQVLDEFTPEATYINVTGNSAQSYPEFKRLSTFYKASYDELLNNFEKSGLEEMEVSNADLKKMFDVNMSFGELDKVPVGTERPTINSLVINGVKVGNKTVPTIVHIDQNDSIQVIMDKTKKTKNTITKHQQVDKWANNNVSEIVKAVSNPEGKRVTEFVALIELPDGTYKIISARKKDAADVDTEQDFISDVGSKFTSSTSKNIFKNENVMLVPVYTEEVTNFDLKEKEVLNQIYNSDDIKAAEAVVGVTPAPTAALSNEDTVKSFLISLSAEEKSKINSNFAAYDMDDTELIGEIMDDYQNGNWSSVNEYLENLKNCK